jgi:hypothetical protein
MAGEQSFPSLHKIFERCNFTRFVLYRQQGVIVSLVIFTRHVNWTNGVIVFLGCLRIANSLVRSLKLPGAQSRRYERPRV